MADSKLAHEDVPKAPSNRLLLGGLGLLSVAAAMALAIRSGLSPAAVIKAAAERLQTAGWAGYACVLVGFSIWVALSLPTTPIEIASGFLYGLPAGTFLGFFCKTCGSCLAFLVVKLLKESRGWGVPDSLQSQLEPLRQAPLFTMLGIRIAPLPLGVKNYGLALCDVPLMEYAAAAGIVNAPFSFLWAGAGSSCHSLSDALDFNKKGDSSGGSMSSKLLFGIPVVLVLLFLGRLVFQRLQGTKDFFGGDEARSQSVALLGSETQRLRRLRRGAPELKRRHTVAVGADLIKAEMRRRATTLTVRRFEAKEA